MFLLLQLVAWMKLDALLAQLPFYTDDPAVTEVGEIHVEFFDEIDGLQIRSVSESAPKYSELQNQLWPPPSPGTRF